jgi:ATP-dependent Clp protease ATP-binding subunit ClpB
MFTPLNREDIKEIVDLNLKTVAKRLLKSGIDFEWTESASFYIAEVGFDPQFGARPIKRVIQKEILNSLSKDILANVVNVDAKIILDFKDGKIIFINKLQETIEATEQVK